MTIEARRTCIGSKAFGIEAHDAPRGDFPVQPSQKDGLGRMCRHHWTEYTRALRKASLASKGTPVHAEAGSLAARVLKPVSARRAHGAPEPIRTRPARGRKTEGEPIVEAVEEASIA